MKTLCRMPINICRMFPLPFADNGFAVVFNIKYYLQVAHFVNYSIVPVINPNM